jgi:ABC-type polysaccharide/polyol phosphate export permease
MVMFWTTPIVYQLDQLSDRLRSIILLSPMSPYVGAYQTIFYFRKWPEPTIWVLAVGYALLALGIGLWLIVRNEDRLAERI